MSRIISNDPNGAGMRKIILFVLIMSLFSFQKILCAAEPTNVVASSYSDRYHLPSCKIAQKIAPEDLLVFNSPEEAAAKGFVPCKKCNPPAPKGMAEPKSNFSHSSKGKTDDQTS